jgi:hypothetical protein
VAAGAVLTGGDDEIHETRMDELAQLESTGEKVDQTFLIGSYTHQQNPRFRPNQNLDPIG